MPTGGWCWILFLWPCQTLCLEATVVSVRHWAYCIPALLVGVKQPRTGAYRLKGGARSWCQNVSLEDSSCQ